MKSNVMHFILIMCVTLSASSYLGNSKSGIEFFAECELAKLSLELSGSPCSMRVNPSRFVSLEAIFRLTTRLANLHLVDFIGETTYDIHFVQKIR